MNLDQYRELVRQHARLENGEAFYNNSYDHARIIMEEMFAKAERRVKILTKALDNRVYEGSLMTEYADYFAASPGASLQILIEDNLAPESLSAHPLIEDIKESSAVEIRRVPKEIVERYSYNCAIADGLHFRFEDDRRNVSAVAAFGRKDTAEHLEDIFDQIWAASEIIDVNNAGKRNSVGAMD